MPLTDIEDAEVALGDRMSPYTGDSEPFSTCESEPVATW